MIFWGIILLVIGVIVWAVGTASRVHPGVRTAGVAIGAIGLVVLVVGLILLLVNRGSPDMVDNDPDAMALWLRAVVS